MKTLKMAIVAGIALAVCACSGSVGTETYSYSDEFPLEGRADARLKVDIDVQYPVSGLNEGICETITTAVNGSLFGREYAVANVEAAARNAVADEKADYMEDNATLARMPGVSSGTLSWDKSFEAKVAGETKKILSFTLSRYSYTGGAHGMTLDTGLNFEKETGRIINETELFEPGYKHELDSLLTACLQESLDSPEDIDMFFTTEIQSNGNFTISGRGITYVYNHYEIAPYAMGTIRVNLPMNKVKGLIRPEYR